MEFSLHFRLFSTEMSYIQNKRDSILIYKVGLFETILFYFLSSKKGLD